MKTYDIIYADPAWQYENASGRLGLEKHYKTMPTEDICALPVRSRASKDAVLFIWGTWPKIADAFKVIDAWGFEYLNCAFLWVKSNRGAETNQGRLFPDELDVLDDFMGGGCWTRANTEFCLLARRGKIKPITHDVRQVVYLPRFKHSEKPSEVRDRIVRLMGDLPRVELFARQRAPGWDAWGNQVEGSIKL